MLGEKSHALIIVVLAFPFFTPFPIPGLSTVMGILSCGVIFSWFRNQEVWMPQRWKNHYLPFKVFVKIFEYGERFSKKFEHLFKARGERVFHNFITRFVLFFLIFTSAVFLALPLPPGTNFPPALAMAVLALAILFEDIFLLILGIVIYCVQAYIIFATIGFLVQKAMPYMQSFLR